MAARVSGLPKIKNSHVQTTAIKAFVSTYLWGLVECSDSPYTPNSKLPKPPALPHAHLHTSLEKRAPDSKQGPAGATGSLMLKPWAPNMGYSLNSLKGVI